MLVLCLTWYCDVVILCSTKKCVVLLCLTWFCDIVVCICTCNRVIVLCFDLGFLFSYLLLLTMCDGFVF